MRSWRKSKSGLKKSSILKNARELRGIYFIDPEDTEFKETIKNARKKLERQLLLLCPVKLWRIVGVVHPTKFRQNLRVFWMLMNPQECVWEIRYRIITKTVLQENVSQIQRVRGNLCAETNPLNVACWHPNMLKMIKQVRGAPSRWIKKEEYKIDFRVPGLSHSVVKEAEHLRVQELVQKDRKSSSSSSTSSRLAAE